jgi:hypothetical protein
LAWLVLNIVYHGRSDVEAHSYVYWVRLAAFVLILLAIVDKNRPNRDKPNPTT